MAAALTLHTYWRSSAAYRVRIALHLKGLAFDSVPVHLVRDGGEQHASDYVALNPQQLVPTLRHGDAVMTQSLAIIEYLDEVFPETPLLPGDAPSRQRARALAQLVACDIHPLGNLRVLQYLERDLGLPGEVRTRWIARWVQDGLAAYEALLAQAGAGDFSVGDAPGIADCALIPQLYNARRFSIDLTPYPRILRVDATCSALPAFVAATPEQQADAPV